METVTRELAIKAVLHGACKFPRVGQRIHELSIEDLTWAESVGVVKTEFPQVPIWCLSGSGYGYGYGSGDGSGYGDGYGDGDGDGDGYGYGSGYGDGYGSGYGSGDGSGYGSGDGDGYGSGDGSGSGSGDGSGYGEGSGLVNSKQFLALVGAQEKGGCIHG